MKASRAEERHFSVFVTTPQSAAEIVIIDAFFNKIGAGTAALEVHLPPGIYKARFKVGTNIADQLFEVVDKDVHLNGPELNFSSPFPFGVSSELIEEEKREEPNFYPAHWQRGQADRLGEALLRGHDRSLGKGESQIFIFIREQLPLYHAPNKKHSPPTQVPWKDLRLVNESGHWIDFLTQNQTTDFQCVARNVKLKSGTYLIAQPEYSDRRLSFELPIIVCDGWCTHVYLSSKTVADTEGPERLTRIADLSDASIMMTRVGTAVSQFEQTFAQIEQTELVRQKVMLGRGSILDDDLEQIVESEQENPMLALYAAHILLQQPNVQWLKIEALTRVLKRWLTTPHPDVEVLEHACRLKSAGRGALTMPPMLGASWDLARKVQPKLVMGNRLLRDFAQYRTAGSMWCTVLRPRKLGSVPRYKNSAITFRQSVDATARRRDINRSESVPRSKKIDYLADEIWLSATPSKHPIEKIDLIEVVELDPTRPIDISKAILRRGLSPSITTNVKSNWQGLKNAMREPNAMYSPFRQALRRRVLDILDSDYETSLQLANLANQFQISLQMAVKELCDMYQDAKKEAYVRLNE